jgi:hypothetical protein
MQEPYRCSIIFLKVSIVDSDTITRKRLSLLFAELLGKKSIFRQILPHLCLKEGNVVK